MNKKQRKVSDIYSTLGLTAHKVSLLEDTIFKNSFILPRDFFNNPYYDIKPLKVLNQREFQEWSKHHVAVYCDNYELIRMAKYVVLSERWDKNNGYGLVLVKVWMKESE